MKKFYVLVFLCISGAYIVNAQQNITISNGTVSACEGTFRDDGPFDGGYSETDYTFTICPDTPGDVIQIQFNAFQLQVSPGNGNSDSFSVFDGDNTGATSLGTYTGNQLEGLTATGTVNNVTGCLTFVFQTNGPANATSANPALGWIGVVSCTTPCANPTAASGITSPTPEAGTQSVSVCLNENVSFADLGSFAEPGFTIANYTWNMDDGTIIEGPNQTTATYAWTEPGEYIVTLTVTDNNGCTNLNLNPLQVLVSTLPVFPGVESVETCFGDEVELTGNAESLLWTALPPQVVSGTTFLSDDFGFNFESNLEFNFFEPDAVLESCEDLLDIVVNMEHSYMGDLEITISCPNGTSVVLVPFGTDSGGGTFLGEPIDDDQDLTPGVGYTYFWDPDATNGTWGQNAQGFGESLPVGSYEAHEDLCALVGCPLNGNWTLSMTDNLGSDNGYIFFWGINFNPALFPDVTTFQPSIGADADSSYWTGPHIIQSDTNLDVITVSPPAPGVYEYQYNVVNSFGCEFDTTITVTFTQAPFVTAGPDLMISCNEITLQGGFQDMPTPSCNNESGTFNYCYGENEDIQWTFCPDNPGDGTAMVMAFTAGSTETNWDFVTIYDGPDTNSPTLVEDYSGPLTDLSWTATNPSGCLTFVFSSDGIISCASGAQEEWTYEVTCTSGGPAFTWEWTPNNNMTNANSPTPTISSLNQTTTFTLTGYPVGFPLCASTDEVTVTLDAALNPGTDSEFTYCETGTPFNMTGLLEGNPNPGGQWTDPAGNPVNPTFTPGVNNEGVYTYTITTPDCEAFAELDLSAIPQMLLTIVDDTTVCQFGTVDLDTLTFTGGQAPFEYRWTFNGLEISEDAEMNYSPAASGEACLSIIDICNSPVSACVNVSVEEPIDVDFIVDTTRACWPYTFQFANLIPPGVFETAEWNFGNGNTSNANSELTYFYPSPGVYDVSLTLTTERGCESSATKSSFISVFQKPEVSYSFGPSPTDIRNTEIQFNSILNGQIDSILWFFGYPNVLDVSAEENPLFTFPNESGGFYPVRLEVVDNNGCKNFYINVVQISDIFQYYLPNAFTPNNDGINDVWKFEGADIDPDVFRLVVFDRWGNTVFETNDPTVAWTGGVDSGDYYAPNGVYNWILRVGSEATGIRKEVSGTVTLMR